MGGDLPKVLIPLSGRPLVHYVVDSAKKAQISNIVVVVGYRADLVQESLDQAYPNQLQYARQERQLGTGDAVKAAMGALPPGTRKVWILSGDVPRLQAHTLTLLGQACDRSGAGLSFATFVPDDAQAYGRILRDEKGQVLEIREARDCSPEQLKVKECNAGIYCVRAEHLNPWLSKLSTDNDQGEYYLTDIVALALASGSVEGCQVPEHEVAGINTPQDLAQMQAQIEAQSATAEPS